MTRYHRARFPSPLRNAGLVEFASDDPVMRRRLGDAVAETDGVAASPLAAKYDAPQQLLRLLGHLQRKLSSRDAESIRCRIDYGHDNDSAADDDDARDESDGPERTDGWFPLAALFGQVGGISVSDYILHRIYTPYLQPIVRSDRVPMGYEFLLRPLPEQAPFRPAELFETARRTGHHAFLDRAARHSAIRMGASHLPPGTKRFVNFLPSSLLRPATCLRDTFDLMKETGTAPEDCVFEVMETEPLDDNKLDRVFDAYREQKVNLALDDVGSGFATLGAVDRLKPDYVKMDRKWVSGCDADPAKQKYVDSLLDRASRFGGSVLAEGVEREEEWDYLRHAGVPLFQGYLFGRAMPVPSKATSNAVSR
ncbi:EAL domain-containing protein [Cohnella suwonensis]|uniref:EAL domain-containing protein n=1 Tax=Cohnella suwonensis TaxID=696072 RepID=A0ABW0LU98_9BACL